MAGRLRGAMLSLAVFLVFLIGEIRAQGAQDQCGLKSDLVIIIDASTSVTEANYKKQLQFTKDLLRNSDIDSGAVRVGILIYSTEVEIQFHLKEYKTKRDVFDAIDEIPYIYGSTNTADAISTMHKTMFTRGNGDRPDVPNTCIVITDGVSNINSRKTIPNAEAARRANIHIYAVGIGLRNTRELDGIASQPASENSFNVQSFDELKGLDKKIFSALCPTEEETTTALVPTKQPGCGLAEVDLVIIIDASTSVTEANFQKMRDFCKDLVDYADIDSGSVRIGVLIYSTDVEIQFNLNEYKTTRAVKDAIDKIPYIYGSTNTADAIRTMHSRMFTTTNGDRRGVPNIGIVLTDGVSNINSRRTIPEANSARAKNIEIYAIGIGLRDTREVDAIANTPTDKFRFNVRDFEELQGLAATIFGGNGDGAGCSKPTTTTIAPEPTCGLTKVDLVIILDASTSVTQTNFDKMLTFAKDIVDKANVDSGSVRIGCLIYSTEVEIQFYLDEYKTNDEVKAAIDKIPYIYGSTNSADALKAMHEKLFNRRKGDRSDVENVAFMITDGISNINSRRTIPEAERAIGKGITIYAIGIGLKDTRELRGMASEPKDDYMYNVQAFDELTGLVETIFGGGEECVNEPPVADAGSDVNIQLPVDYVTLDGTKSTDDAEVVQYQWIKKSGGRVTMQGEESAILNLDNLEAGEYIFTLSVFDVDGQSDDDDVRVTVEEQDFPPIANAGEDVEIQIPDNVVTLNGDASSDDNKVVRYEWEFVSGDSSSVSTEGMDGPSPTLSSLSEGEYTLKLTVYDELGQMDEDTVTINVKAQDFPPTADAGNDIQIQLPDDTVTLNGDNSFDDVEVVRYQWEFLSGDDSSVKSSGMDTAYPKLSGLKEGDYTLKLRVYDGLGQLDEDTVSINVKERDFPPVADAGEDTTIKLPVDSVKLDGTGSTDDVRIVDYSWKLKSGDGSSVTIDNTAGPETNARGLKAGTYTFNLTVTDELGQTDVDTVTITVTAADIPPVARAGDDVTIKLPVNYVTLDGSRSSDDVGIVRYRWRMRSGDKSALKMKGDRSPVLTLTEMKPGNYRFSLTVIDGKRLKDTDYVEVTVLPGNPRPSPCPTEAPTTTGEPGVCSADGDIVFILDSSGSVGQDNFYRVLNFTYATIEGLDIDNGRFRVGVTTFSDTSRLDFNLDEFKNKEDMEAALKQVVYMYGNTHTAHALRRARLEMFTQSTGDRPNVPNVVVIITDGQSNVNHELTIPEARALKAAGVTIITVAVGFTSETSELVGLTSPPVSENLIYVQNYESLNQLKNQLISPLCTDSNLCRKKPCQNGGVCMDGIRSFVCLCPDDFFGDTCSKRCGEPADVVIVLDSSNTVGEYNFGRLKEYAEHLVREMNKDSCDVNIGFLKYSSAAMVQVNLGMYADTETNVRALDQISYTRGRANMAAAFRALRTQMFNGRNGDRSGAKNIAYFLTDGTNDVNADRTEPEAELTISSGVRVIPIGINLRERFELDNIANNQGLNVIEISDESNLLENTDAILQPLLQGNDFCAENPCSNGGQCTNEPFGFTCDCPIGYTGETCQKRCTAKGDVVFAVDTSRYVTRSELKKVRRFLRSIVKRMRFKRNEFSVGMVQFTDWAKVTLDFNEGRSKKAVRSKIAGLRVHGGDPEPATALAKANYRIFNSNGADREKPDYLILVTKSMRGENEILKEANKLKLRGTRVLGVGLGLTDKEREFMESAVSMPYRETAMFATDAKELADIADRVVEYMCDDEDLCAESPCRNGGVCKRLGGDFYCECGIGYAGRFCENRCEARADIVFLLDSSGSVGHIDFRRVKQFVHNMVSDLQIGRDKTRVGLVTYSSTSRHGFFMSKYYSLYELQNAVAGIGYEYGDTNTAAGLRLVRERYFGGANGDRQNIQNFLIVVTDGVSNINPDETITEANLLKDDDVHIYAVGIGNFDPYEINSIASPPASQNAFILSDYKALGNISSSIVKKTCRDPTVCDENPCRNGGLCVPGINGPFCECRVGYRGENCQDSCVSVKDIYFLMDSSDSVGAKNYQTALNFIASIAEEFSGEGSHNRFSLLTFSDEVQIVFSLGRYTRLPILMNAIKFARYRPGNTNTAGAFRTVSEISVDALGDRYDAENIVFLITDGNGNVDGETTVDAAKYLKDNGARIIPIAVNMNDYSEMEQIASNRKDIFKVSSFNDLESILEDIVVTTCRNGNEITTNG